MRKKTKKIVSVITGNYHAIAWVIYNSHATEPHGVIKSEGIG